MKNLETHDSRNSKVFGYNKTNIYETSNYGRLTAGMIARKRIE